MKLYVYSMKDNLSGFLNPTFEVNDSMALRNFAYAINRHDSLLYANAKDFDLYKIAIFDTEKGEIEPLQPSIVATGSSVLENV